MKQTLWSWFKYIALFVLIITLVNAWRTHDVPAHAPEFTAHYADGSAVSLSAFRAAHTGKPVALIFWAEWCPVCRTEEHSINRLAHDADIPLLIIATQSGSAAQVQAVLDQRQLDWRVVMDGDASVLSAYGLSGVPSFAVIDANGRLHFTQMGYTSELGMRARIWLARWL